MDERVTFERWAMSEGQPTFRYSGGEYSSLAVAFAWRSWQARAALQAAPGREPDGYAYRYPALMGDGTVIRFETGGREINASKPIEAIPYWLGTPPTSATVEAATVDEWCERIWPMFNAEFTDDNERKAMRERLMQAAQALASQSAQPQAEAQAGETAKVHVLDQRPSSPDESLWLVENKDGSKEIADAATKGPRAGMAPPWNLTYREALKRLVESLESSAQFWMEVFNDYRSGDTKRITFVSGSTAYTAHVGIHKGRDGLGFCGRTIAVKMADGHEFISNNVWCRGTVPPKLRTLLKNNATMDWDALRNKADAQEGV